MSILGVDVGTSTCKALAIDRVGQALATAGRTYTRSSPQPGWFEIDPDQFLTAIDDVIREVAGQTSSDPIEAISFSVFGGSFVPLDSNNHPLCNLISTTDNRAAGEVEQWKHDFGARRTYEITGLIPHNSFLLMKALAFRRSQPDLWANTAKLASATELIHTHLGLPAVCDSSTASTYMACDLSSGGWSDDILSAARLDRSLLPSISQSGSPIGEIGGDVARKLGLADGVRVIAGGHDQQMASFGAGLTEPGAATDSLGTVEAISTLIARPQLDDRFFSNNLPNWKHVWRDLYFTLVYSFSCGDLLNWAMRAFYGAELTREIDALKQALEALPNTPARGVVLPHFCGSGTPYMDPASRGAIVGLDFSSSKQDILRAIVDSQNYEMRLNLDLWRGVGINIDRLRAYGGLARNDNLLQIKADILGLEVARLESGEAGCFGAAVLAGVGAGLIDDAEAFLREHVRETRSFEPRCEFAETHAELYDIYKGLYPAVSETNHRLAQVNQ